MSFVDLITGKEQAMMKMTVVGLQVLTCIFFTAWLLVKAVKRWANSTLKKTNSISSSGA